MSDKFESNDRSAALDVIVDGLVKRINSRNDPVGDVKYLNERLNNECLNNECLNNSIIDKAAEIAPEGNYLTVSDLIKILYLCPSYEYYRVEFQTACHVEKLYVASTSIGDHFSIFLGSYSKESSVANLLLSLIKCSGRTPVKFDTVIEKFKLINYTINYAEKAITLYLNEE